MVLNQVLEGTTEGNGSWFVAAVYHSSKDLVKHFIRLTSLFEPPADETSWMAAGMERVSSSKSFVIRISNNLNSLTYGRVVVQACTCTGRQVPWSAIFVQKRCLRREFVSLPSLLNLTRVDRLWHWLNWGPDRKGLRSNQGWICWNVLWKQSALISATSSADTVVLALRFGICFRFLVGGAIGFLATSKSSPSEPLSSLRVGFLLPLLRSGSSPGDSWILLI